MNTKFSGTVIAQTSQSGKTTTFKMAVNNFTSKDSTEKPEATWITLEFLNAGLEKYLAENVFAQVNGKNPHVTISGGQLLTKSYIHPNTGKKISYMTLKVFDEKSVQATKFEKGVNSSFNLVENAYATIVRDFTAFGTSGMKGTVVVNHKSYTDKHGNEVKPNVFLNLTVFNVAPEMAEKLKKGQFIKIVKANFKTSNYEKDGVKNSFTELLSNQIEIYEKDNQEAPASTTTSVNVGGQDVPVEIEEPQTPVSETSKEPMNEEEIPF